MARAPNGGPPSSRCSDRCSPWDARSSRSGPPRPTKRRKWRAGIGALVAANALLAAAACGSRTGLPSEMDALTEDDAMSTQDTRARDAASDRGADRDALPRIDATPLPDVVRSDCPDASVTFIYVITVQYDLWSFNPASGAFRRIGRIACPAAPNSTPFSMAVDRRGVAYVVYNDGELFRVSTATAACIPTGYVVGQQGIETFGMGFASDTNGPKETLFIASDSPQGEIAQLGAIDVTSFDLSVVGAFSPQILNAELTGTGDGRLFGFYALGGGSAIGQIDKRTAQVIAETPLPQVDQGNQWAFGFWGGDFYMFTGLRDAGSDVTRFRPLDGTVSVIAHLPEDIVGAGVSTCAPEE